MFISQVSDDLLVLMLSTLPAADLRLAAATCSHWREWVPAAAEIRLRRRRQGLTLTLTLTLTLIPTLTLTLRSGSAAAGRAFLSGTMPCRAGCARCSLWSCWRPPWAQCLRTRGARTTSSCITRHPNPNATEAP